MAESAIHALPVTINSLHLKGGFLSYSEVDGFRMAVSQIELQAENIQNIQTPEGEYPSMIELGGMVHGNGRIHVVGKANFFAGPFPGIAVGFALTQV